MEPSAGMSGQRSSARRFRVTILVIAGCLFLALLVHQRAMEASVRDRALLNEGVAAPPRPVADVAQAVRALKLITVEIKTSVTAEVKDESWRGDVTAKVSAPATLSYGVDLSALSPESVGYSALGGGYVVRVPAPMRLATEVWSEVETREVSLGWMRLRSRAGEFYLGLARRALNDQARKMVLAPEDARKVVDATREQVEKLVRTFLGTDRADTPIVVIVDEPKTPETEVATP